MLAHLRTVRPYLRHAVRPYRPPAPAPWSARVRDPDGRVVRLTGDLRDAPGANEIVVLVHGLGSARDSFYCLRGARAFAARGMATLSLSLRGSDLRGEDFYNVAQTADLRAAIASRELERFERVHVLGYSMGGYAALHLACEPGDERLRAVAAVCTPLDLAAAQRHVDAPGVRVYRRRVLHGLVAIYAAVARRRAVPTPLERVRGVRTIHEWDTLAIAPRYGFDGPEHYYRELSVVPRLSALRRPALLVAARDDPIVPPSTIEPFLSRARPRNGRAPRLVVRWIARAGHLGFASDVDLGQRCETGLEAQLAGWFGDV